MNRVVLTRSRRAHASGCTWFWSWAVLGCAAALGALTIGVPVLAAVVLLGGLMAAQRRLHRSALGFVTGFGVPLLYVAWLNREGPGVTCWQTATDSGCTGHLNPLPWLLLGAALFIAGVIVYARRGS